MRLRDLMTRKGISRHDSMHSIAFVSCTIQTCRASSLLLAGRRPSESEGVLHFSGDPGVRHVETQGARFVLRPTLAEDEEDVIASPQSPSRTALPAEVRPLIVELDEIEERQHR